MLPASCRSVSWLLAVEHIVLMRELRLVGQLQDAPAPCGLVLGPPMLGTGRCKVSDHPNLAPIVAKFISLILGAIVARILPVYFGHQSLQNPRPAQCWVPVVAKSRSIICWYQSLRSFGIPRLAAMVARLCSPIVGTNLCKVSIIEFLEINRCKVSPHRL